jgi:hypothetical protein
MQYPSKQTYIDAVRWDAPTDDTSDGNLAELQAFVGDVAKVEKQNPWNPAEGQNCVLLVTGGYPIAYDAETGEPFAFAPDHAQAILPGDYLARVPEELTAADVRAADGLGIIPGERFEAAYDVPASTVERQKTVPADGTVKAGIEVPVGEAGTVSNEPAVTE